MPPPGQELQTDCQALNDDPCRHYAAFFRAKIDFVSTLPARAAVLGFQTIAEEPVGRTTGTAITYDQKTVDMARRLWAFYNANDPLKGRRDAPDGPSFYDEYPMPRRWSPAALSPAR